VIVVCGLRLEIIACGLRLVIVVCGLRLVIVGSVWTEIAKDGERIDGEK
jgi:hypothetical protein